MTDNVLFRIATVCLMTMWTALLPGSGCVNNVCDSDSDCAAGARCNPVTHRCYHPDAGADAGDAGDATQGDAGDAEPECTQSSQCTDPTEPICDATDLQCRACQSDPECLARDPALPVCDAPACVKCTDSAQHCTNPVPICEPTTHLCRACADHGDCAGRDPSTPACDAPACVECTDSALHCSGTAPICEPTTNLCRPCASHAECAVPLAGGVCDWVTGACLAEGEVIYVDEQALLCSDAGGCTQATPCCTLQVGVDTVTAGRTTILVAPGTYSPIDVVDASTMWIVGESGAEVGTGVKRVHRLSLRSYRPHP